MLTDVKRWPPERTVTLFSMGNRACCSGGPDVLTWPLKEYAVHRENGGSRSTMQVRIIDKDAVRAVDNVE